MTGPVSAICMIATLSICASLMSPVSDETAVTRYGVPTVCVSAALLDRKDCCALRISSFALATATTLRSESDTVVAPALTFAIATASCCSASASWARAAASDSCAARIALYCVLTVCARLNCVVVCPASAAMMFAFCVRMSFAVLPPSNNVIDELKPRL
jgi:hypothetical protein